MFIELDGWKIDLRFSAAHFIPSHDKCSRLHGNDYGIRVRVYGEVAESFIIDFLELKRYIEEIIGGLDHRVLVPEKDGISKHSISGDQVIVEYQGKKFSLFKPDVYFIPDSSTSSEALAKFIGNKLRDRIVSNQNVSKIELCVDEGPGMGAWVEIGIEK